MKYLITAFLFVFIFSFSYGQSEKLVIESAVVVSDNDATNPVPGTIKYIALIQYLDPAASGGGFSINVAGT